jgi:hypothetical protein
MHRNQSSRKHTSSNNDKKNRFRPDLTMVSNRRQSSRSKDIVAGSSNENDKTTPSPTMIQSMSEKPSVVQYLRNFVTLHYNEQQQDAEILCNRVMEAVSQKSPAKPAAIDTDTYKAMYKKWQQLGKSARPRSLDFFGRSLLLKTFVVSNSFFFLFISY